jgi:very-short-patch-repair endonuclease
MLRRLSMNCSTTQKRLCGEEDCQTCYDRSFATHPRAVDWSPSNELKPNQVLRNSNKKYKFNCTDCGHELEMIVNNVAKGQWCKYCNSDGLCEDMSCEFCFKKSFASHPMAEAWSNQNEIQPRNILRNADKKFSFDCHTCKHTFQTVLYSVSRGTACPYCTNQQLCMEEKCNTCFNKSCASHEIAEAWSLTNKLQPRQVFLQSNKKINFICRRCNHEYNTQVHHFVHRNGSCPYCSNKYLCDKEDCKSCFQKSFASHPRVNCWSEKNEKDPRQIFKGSDTTCIFNCDECKSEFSSKAYNVLTGYWCPYCKKKTEAKVLKFLSTQEGDWKSQLRFNWCRYSKTGNGMPIDFGSMEKKIMIEVDGVQHFTQVSNWNTPDEIQEKDVEKIIACNKNGYHIIHISQEDVWNDVYDWKQVLQMEMNELQEKEDPECIFISKKEIYAEHLSKLDGSVAYKMVQPSS